jgi:dipeptidyl-peptidase III
MKKMKNKLIVAVSLGMLTACVGTKTVVTPTNLSGESSIVVDKFADIQVLRLPVDGWDKLSLQQKKYCYFLAQAGLAGRDINFDQNNEYNLQIRKLLEGIFTNNQENGRSDEWMMFETWAKQFFFSNGIHHHYGMDKLTPQFNEGYFRNLVAKSGQEVSDELMQFIFEPTIGAKRKVKDPKQDMVVASANNFYGEGVTQQMVEEFYQQKADPTNNQPIEAGLNSTLILKDGKVTEDVWKLDGRYGAAIEQIIYWLKKASEVTENEAQRAALVKLVEFYATGDLKIWDEYNVLWVKATAGDIDYINGFIEVYGDALGKRANFEAIVQVKDFDASEKMAVLAKNVQWFEDNSPLRPEHKKKSVVGVSYKVVQAISESGDAAPSTPIGVNLPNNNWIRQEHGSKSVSLGNVIAAYEKAGGPAVTEEFANDEEEINRAKKYAGKASKMHTALHEVIGHASGQINAGVGQPAETLKNYASTLEEARADLVGLYYIFDPKMVELGLIESLEVGKAAYDNYIRNGMMVQLQRLEIGKQLEEEHMQNRQLVAAWVFEKGMNDKVIVKNVRNGKTYYDIQDYTKLRALFGVLLREIQRIKSEGDYNAGKLLVETYGVAVNPTLHKEVLDRVAPMNIKPFSGFVYPILTPVYNEKGEILDIKLENNQSFIEQMLYYGKNYNFLK